MTLLTGIISGNGVSMNKYSIAYNELRAVIELEQKDRKDKLPKTFFDEFDSITKSKDSLTTELKDIPLLILEQYFFRNNKDLNAQVYIEYNYKNITTDISYLYLILEDFFNRLYILAVKIADVYNLEIKIKPQNNNESQYL